MKTLLVRVNKADVKTENKTVSSIGKGIAIFVCFAEGDNDSTLVTVSEKIVNLRIFEDEKGKMAFSVKDKEYMILCIPNFTICANTTKGRRPSFEDAMPQIEAKDMFDKLVMLLYSKGIGVETGSFGKHMNIDLEMDGPVNIILGSRR